MTKGYPYFIQEYCNTIWDRTEENLITEDDVKNAMPEFQAFLDASFFKVRFDRCTKRELISKGIIYSTGRGEVDFTVPLFDSYLKRINPELKLGIE